MKIRELFNNESKWTKGYYARTKIGELCGVQSEDAVCWCLQGARYKCYPEATFGFAEVHKKLWDRLGS